MGPRPPAHSGPEAHQPSGANPVPTACHPAVLPARAVSGVAGILLTGGQSRRMGADKGRLRITGEPLAPRLGRLLSRATHPVVEAGPGWSGLPVVREPLPGRGPLVAVAAARHALAESGHGGPALVLACDLPLVHEPLLRLLASWPGRETVVPIVAGRPQPLCARWSPEALSAGAELVSRTGQERPERGPSVHRLLSTVPVTWLGADDWGAVATEETFADADSPADLEALGLTWSWA